MATQREADETQTAVEGEPSVPAPQRVRPWWRSNGYGRLLGGQAVSAIGSQITFIALPLIAVVSMGAGPGAMGLLGAVDNLPYLLIGLWVGVFVDRHARRRLMVASDLLRAVAVASVPIAALLGWLGFAQLCVVAFVVGIGNIVFDVSCQAQLPELVDDQHLVPANGALQTSASMSMVAAPGLVGLLIKVVGAPVSMLIDVGTYLFSALSIASIRTPEQHRPAPEASTWEQVREGWRLVLADRRLVGLGGGMAMVNLAMNASMAVMIFFLANRLGMDAGMIGLVFVAFGVGAAIGAMSAGALAAKIGTGNTLLTGPLLAGAGLVVFATSGTPLSPAGWPVPLVFAGAILMGIGMMAFSSLAAGMRQLLAPEAARGKVLGTLRFVELGVMPLGSVIGGAIGQVAGAIPATLVSAAILASAALWVVATPLHRLRELPTS
jgi:MFS family permease